ncbi:MAG: DUF6873 family GME fold protein [Oscillospiraceae bacterium]|jgi:hypothetical protein
MSTFLKVPHLPRGRVDLLAVGENYAPLLAPALEKRGVRVLVCPPNPDIDPRLRSHADLSVFHLGDSRFVLAAYLRGTAFSRELEALGAQLLYAERKAGPLCPADAGLCALTVGDRLFHAPFTTDPAILRTGAFHFVPVRQHYAKCAVCPIGEHSAMTADPGMERALRAEGIDILRLAPGGVRLAGFREGFFGGAAFLLAPDLLALTGRPDALSGWDAASANLAARGIRTLSLTDAPLFDIGSTILLTEQRNEL